MKSIIDISRPAIAVVRTTYGAGSGTGSRYFPGYWQPDGSWADVDAGPGGETLPQAIATDLDAGRPAVVRELAEVNLTIQSFGSGELVMATYHASDLDASGDATVRLPIDPDRGCHPDTFMLRIELGNAAIRPESVGAKLREVAETVDATCKDLAMIAGRICDNNGSVVGDWAATLPRH